MSTVAIYSLILSTNFSQQLHNLKIIYNMPLERYQPFKTKTFICLIQTKNNCSGTKKIKLLSLLQHKTVVSLQCYSCTLHWSEYQKQADTVWIILKYVLSNY